MEMRDPALNGCARFWILLAGRWKKGIMPSADKRGRFCGIPDTKGILSSVFSASATALIR